MNNAFSQIVAIFVSISLFFGLPLLYATERLYTARQYYVLSESVALIDSICNTGFLTKEMYDSYLHMISNGEEVYEVSLVKSSRTLYLEEDGTITYTDKYVTEEEILDGLRFWGQYRMHKGDFLRICVKRIRKNPLLWAEPEEKVVAYYGGMVRYEVD